MLVNVSIVVVLMSALILDISHRRYSYWKNLMAMIFLAMVFEAFYGAALVRKYDMVYLNIIYWTMWSFVMVLIDAICVNDLVMRFARHDRNDAAQGNG